MKHSISCLLGLALLLSLLAFPAPARVAAAGNQPSTYSDEYNSGTRHVPCTTLDGTGASAYYTGSNTYAKLSAKSESALLQSLRTLMKDTHDKNSSYNDCKNMAGNTDCEKENGKVILIYTSHETTRSAFQGGGTGWDREHVWPKNLGGFDKSGAGADLHHIRPSDSKVNNSRSSDKYGNVSGGKAVTGYYGIVGGYKGGGYFEPLDNVKGDVARICLYVYVRYGGELSQCSKITNVFQSVDVLLEWMELDPVDTWEMGRNEVVEAYQGNRNVFIDYPEYAWLLFGEEIPANMTTPSGSKSSATEPTAPTETTAPPPTETTAPPPTETTAPPVTETTAPPATETTAPSATETTAPSAAETTAPPASESTTPPTTGATQPPASENTEPPVTDSTTPANTDGSVPPTTDADTPPASGEPDTSGTEDSASGTGTDSGTQSTPVPTEATPAPTPADDPDSTGTVIWVIICILLAAGIAVLAIGVIRKKQK